ncbi:YbaK/EbsC family protein, partial [uncultured Campylobacter sp.]|uniref:YbaK/EbsC family protein n=1 Tax=uncultured Campylobacter sp. TaxID=218934 RepID=UPI00261981B3
LRGITGGTLVMIDGIPVNWNGVSHLDMIPVGAVEKVEVVKGGGAKRYVLAVLPADYKADLQLITQALGGTRASLASPDEVIRLTDCVFGSVPPFSFHEELELIADPSLLTRYAELAFNAGLLDRSIILNTKDYERIARPRLVKFAMAE